MKTKNIMHLTLITILIFTIYSCKNSTDSVNDIQTKTVEKIKKEEPVKVAEKKKEESFKWEIIKEKKDKAFNKSNVYIRISEPTNEQNLNREDQLRN